MERLFIREIEPADRKNYLELLLLADPLEKMVDRYLPDSEMFVWENEQGELRAEAVVDRAGEIKNLAVVESWHGKGIGRQLLKDLEDRYRGKFEYLLVGTSAEGVGFYEKCGFRYSHIVPDFFTEHYQELIQQTGSDVENGDMIYLRTELQ